VGSPAVSATVAPSAAPTATEPVTAEPATSELADEAPATNPAAGPATTSIAVAKPAASSPATAAPAAPGVPDDATIARLAPDLGASQPLPPSGAGDCLGPVNGPDGKPARVPCQCPPTRENYIAQLTANVRASKAIHNPSVGISFPVGDSVADKQARITAAAITLQNLDGPGKGCPLVSTTLGVQSKALDA
jgi:hypothetical protein